MPIFHRLIMPLARKLRRVAGDGSTAILAVGLNGHLAR